MALPKIRVSNLKNPKTLLSILLQLSILILSVSYSLMYPQPVNATLTTAYVRFDRQSAAAALGGVVCMQSTQTSASDTKVIVTFPSTFSIAGANTAWTVDTTAANLPSGAVAWPGITGPELVDTSTNSAIFHTTQLNNASDLFCFHFTGATSTVGTTGTNLTGTVQTQTTTGTAVETMSYATSITSGANSEQIGVTASVSASFSFALSGGATGQALPLGVLNSGSVTTAPYLVQATISTNAHNGFLAWVKGATVGLHSTTAGADISAVSGGPIDLSSNTGWGLYGTGASISTAFVGGASSVGQVDNAEFYQFANATGYQSGTNFYIGARAKPTTSTPAATDYTQTVTVVASGSF